MVPHRVVKGFDIDMDRNEAGSRATFRGAMHAMITENIVCG